MKKPTKPARPSGGATVKRPVNIEHRSLVAANRRYGRAGISVIVAYQNTSFRYGYECGYRAAQRDAKKKAKP